MEKPILRERKFNKKSHNTYRTSQNSGITLVALIITIIVLLILAVVAIRAVQGDGIISKAKEAQTKYEDAQNEEEIKLALNEWKIVGATTNKTFSKFMAEKFGENKVQAGSSENEVIVTLANGSQYKVTEEGTITSTKGIVLSPSPMTLELQEGTTVTGNLTARLNGIEGEITWSNSDNTKATISATTGESITVTAVAKGSTTITATCGSYTATCKVTVAEPIPVGSYVQYNVPYTDMYQKDETDSSKYKEYTATTGWRYLGKDDNGNNLIVSTGIPAILYYHPNSNIGNTADGGANSWWATIAEISSENTPAIYRTTKGYDYNTDSGEPAKYAAYGLRYKFESIPFTYQASGTSASTANKGIFRKVGSTTSGTDINLNFRANGVNVVDVHNLTLAELNRATNSASGSTSLRFKDLTGTANGLFDMQDLENYTQNYCYWLASPNTSYRNGVCYVSYTNSGVDGYGYFSNGVRPVVTLPSNVNLTVINN